jgi:hypothetical protein
VVVQVQVPLFFTRHVLVNVCPIGNSVPSGMVTSETKVIWAQPVAVGLGTVLVGTGVDDVGLNAGVSVIVGVCVMVGALAVIWAMTVWATEVDSCSKLIVAVGVGVCTDGPQALRIKAPAIRMMTMVRFFLFICPLSYCVWVGLRITGIVWWCEDFHQQAFPRFLNPNGNYYTEMAAAPRRENGLTAEKPLFNPYLTVFR